MRITNKNLNSVLSQYKTISKLSRINAVLAWDLNVNLPLKASEARAGQSAYITELIADKWLAADFKKQVDDLDETDTKLTPIERASVRNLKHTGKYYFQVPKEIVVEFSETTSKAFMVWQAAKQKNSFKDFLPHLTKVIKLNQIIANHLGYRANPYDALLDIYEPGLTAVECQKIFTFLQPKLVKLLQRIRKSRNYTRENELVNNLINYPVDDQKQLANFVLRKMNYDLEAGRMDISSHPFTETLGVGDVRITNRYKINNFVESLMVAMHEGGHALYEQGVNASYADTPLEGGVSLGIHESQSRFWENQIGRSREFSTFLTPILHAFYPEQLAKYGVETLYETFNHVYPSFIRTEADEVTYNLHIALRFEIENALINNKIKPKDLPDIWRERMKKYLGVVPPTDREGVLQDVHWSIGSFGYFPTYTLGNLYAAQITRVMKKDLKINTLIEKGEFGTILAWLRSAIHQHGGLYWPNDLIVKVTQEKLNPNYFIAYLTEKYLELYK